jgi:hypothetical protein
MSDMLEHYRLDGNGLDEHGTGQSQAHPNRAARRVA